MIRRCIWSIITIVIACSTANGADIRRVVTGLDDSNKAIALFDTGRDQQDSTHGGIRASR